MLRSAAVMALGILLLAACGDSTDEAENVVEERESTVVGQLDRYPALDAEGLLPRDVLVWTPPGYDSEADRRYPVLYMHDAQNVFDEASSYKGIEWGVDETVVRLAQERLIEPLIVVALGNTSTRTADYSPGPRGEAYMAFLVERVKPMIDANYRTRPGKAHTLTAGASMGGLISCMLGWRYPDVFGAAMCFSPAFKVEGEPDWSLFFTASGGPRRDVFFYVDNGGQGLEKRLQPGIDHMLDFWRSEGYVEGEDFLFVRDVAAAHDESAWARRFPAALQRALGHARQQADIE